MVEGTEGISGEHFLHGKELVLIDCGSTYFWHVDSGQILQIMLAERKEERNVS